MADDRSPVQVKFLVLGTGHEYQRYQRDNDAHRDQIRHKFGTTICEIIESERIELVAEEAGNDAAVADLLTAQGFPQGPVEPIAKQLSLNRCRHIDIRPPGDHGTDEDYEQRMLSLIIAEVREATSILVIVGEDHRMSVAQRLSEKGFKTESCQFLQPNENNEDQDG